MGRRHATSDASDVSQGSRVGDFESVQRGGAAYQQLRDALSRSFVPDTREQQRLASRQLGERAWKTHESIAQYAREIERLLNKALSNLDDATREDQLIKNLSPDYPEKSVSSWR